MAKTGISIDANLDLEFEDGDFKIDDTLNQEIHLLIKAQKGQFYQHPLTGFGIDNYRNANVNAQITSSDLKAELANDNIEVDEVKVNLTVEGDLTISLAGEKRN